jgi:hypothetical protein
VEGRGGKIKKGEGRTAPRERMRWRRSTRLVRPETKVLGARWREQSRETNWLQINAETEEVEEDKAKRERGSAMEEKTYPWRLCDTKEEKGSVPCALSLVARAVRGRAGVSTDWRAARARSRRRQNYGRLLARGQATAQQSATHSTGRTDLAQKGLQYQQVAIGQLEGGGSTTEVHGMLSSVVVRREKERAHWREGSRRRMSVQRG